MNNLMAALAQRLLAVWIERIAGSKITTIAGILGIAATFLSQLTTFIPAKYATYVALAGVIVAGTAAILARDSASAPAAKAASSQQVKLGCFALIMLLVVGTLPIAGCNGTQVAQDIVNWTPALQSAVNVVGTSVSVLDPAAAPIFAAATVGFDAASNVVVAEAKAYLANPNQTILAQLQTAVVTFQQQVNSALLQAAKISNPASQQHANAAINSVATVINTILALVQSISSKAAVAQMASEATIKLARVEPYLNHLEESNVLAAHYRMSVDEGAHLATVGDYQLQAAGF